VGLLSEGFLEGIQRAGTDVSVHNAKSAESESCCAYFCSVTMPRIGMVVVVLLTRGVALVVCIGERFSVLGSY
jgi:hypothetical protein